MLRLNNKWIKKQFGEETILLNTENKERYYLNSTSTKILEYSIRYKDYIYELTNEYNSEENIEQIKLDIINTVKKYIEMKILIKDE